MKHKLATTDLATERDMYSVAQFCARNGGISRSTFYKMCAAGRGPKTNKVESRTLITRESAARWRAELDRVAA